MRLPVSLRIIHNADATCRDLELFNCHLADDDRAVTGYFTRKSGEKARWAIYFSDISIFVLYHAWPGIRWHSADLNRCA